MGDRVTGQTPAGLREHRVSDHAPRLRLMGEILL